MVQKNTFSPDIYHENWKKITESVVDLVLEGFEKQQNIFFIFCLEKNEYKNKFQKILSIEIFYRGWKYFLVNLNP